MQVREAEKIILISGAVLVATAATSSLAGNQNPGALIALHISTPKRPGRARQETEKSRGISRREEGSSQGSREEMSRKF